MYVLLAEAGYLIPIHSVDSSDEVYDDILRGKQVSVEQDLQEEFAKG